MLRPWRTGMPGRPEVPLPPVSMPAWDSGRPLKRWRWVGAFSEEVMLCAAVARVGPVPVSWWALWDRETRTLVENTVRGARAVRLEGVSVEVDDGPGKIGLVLDEGTAVETVSPHGPSYIWTRKRPARAHGFVTIADRRIEIDTPAFVDESAGYHARETTWQWTAGVGVAKSGAEVAWNLVTGLHDAPDASERTVWVDGVPHHVDPQPFAADLSGVGDLSFTPEATRTRSENLVVVSSDYEQPFGHFTGSLPVAGELAVGLGVMERHSAKW